MHDRTISTPSHIHSPFKKEQHTILYHKLKTLFNESIMLEKKRFQRGEMVQKKAIS